MYLCLWERIPHKHYDSEKKEARMLFRKLTMHGYCDAVWYDVLYTYNASFLNNDAEFP